MNVIWLLVFLYGNTVVQINTDSLESCKLIAEKIVEKQWTALPSCINLETGENYILHSNYIWQ